MKLIAKRTIEVDDKNVHLCGNNCRYLWQGSTCYLNGAQEEVLARGEVLARDYLGNRIRTKSCLRIGNKTR